MSLGNALIDALFQEYDSEEGRMGFTEDDLEDDWRRRRPVTPYRDDRHALVVQNAQLQRNVGELTEQLTTRRIGESEVAKARIAIHATSSLFVYSVGAAIVGGDMMDHPHLLAVVATLNLLIWTVGSIFRRFGT